MFFVDLLVVKLHVDVLTTFVFMGLFDKLVTLFGLRKQEVKVLVVGLNNSGKTTVLNHFKSEDDKSTEIVPTVGFNIEKFKNPKDMIQIRNNLWDESFRETSYFFHKGFRHVYPYFYTYRSFVKKHWVGLSIENAYTSTFYAVHDQNWVERDIAAGLIRVNGNRPTKDYVLKFGDALEHTVHRHEMPVSDFKVDILHYDSNIIVINKPPSLAIHPTGRYQHNTLIYILAREYNMRDAYIIHRLDKGTSGVFLLGRNKSTASFFSQENANRKTCKTYVARVVGKFPGTIECEEAITPLDYKTRIMKVCKTGKPSKTVFEIMSYNPKTNRSIVLCRPYTGRTHQIRVHLQYLGFPIDNDPIYNSPMFGENRGKGGVLECSKEILRAYESTRSRWAPLEHATSRDIVCEPWLTMAKGPFVDQARAIIDNEWRGLVFLQPLA
ncbi:hypothetical protein FOCC_FOCC004105 [Frankliniella occidentalis]|nr:hypothetical protein FOCC_FOCC004105 [Frankliniella occidentalis]